MSSSQSNASTATTSRPRGYERTTSEADVHRQRYSLADNERALLARNWTTTGIQGDSQQQRRTSPRDAAVSAEFTLVGPGLADDDNVAAFAQSWSSGFGDVPTGGRGAIAVGLRTEAELQRRNSARSLIQQQLDQQGPDGLGISSAIHDAARIKDYTRVRELSTTNPEDAQFVGQGGWTALHHLCDRRCPEVDVVDACIRACPDVLLKPEESGRTPLHLACRNKAPRGVVDLLLHLYPANGKITASKPDKKKRSPLWYAVRYDAPPGVVPMLLEVDPSVVLSDDQHAESPLALIWDSWAEKLDGARTLRPYLHPEQSENGQPVTPKKLRKTLERQPGLLEKWKRVNMFLKAPFGFPLREGEELADVGDRKWRILHATAAVHCHPTLFEMACALHPEQASELDENDLYGAANGGDNRRQQSALHLAASSNASGPIGKAVITTLLRLYPDAAQMPDGIDGSHPLHRIVENKHKQHWTVDGVNPLYMIFPGAVERPDNNGKLPLHRAAAAITGQESENDLATRSVICNMVEVYPVAASRADSAGCLPLHLIAKNGEVWNEEVDAVYEAHQAAVTTRTRAECNNSLPIHLAAANPVARQSMIERLVELNPRGVSQSDRQGKLPFHLACEKGKDWIEGGLEVIYDAFPQAGSTSEDNERHWMALHMASASSTVCGPLINKLVELNREACDIADSQGRFPLHLACESGKNWLGGLEAIFEGNPLAISSGDIHGRLPFYIAALKYTSGSEEEVVNGAENEGQQAADSGEDQAERRRLKAADELDIMFNLLRCDPTVLPHS